MYVDTNTKQKNLWQRMRSKPFREVFLASDIASAIGIQVFNLRGRAGWTQSELANRSEMAQARISLIENAGAENLTLSTLRRIAAAFDVALLVRFVPFSALTKMAVDPNPAWSVPDSFDNDALAEPDVTANDITAADLFSSAYKRSERRNKVIELNSLVEAGSTPSFRSEQARPKSVNELSEAL